MAKQQPKPATPKPATPKPNPQWPSTVKDHKSGGKRGNNPPKK